MSGRGNVTLFRDGCVRVCVRVLCVYARFNELCWSRGEASGFFSRERGYLSEFARCERILGPDTDRTDWFVIAEAEHGYASTMPMPDDMRTVTKRPKTKKSQGSRLVS